MSIQRVAAFLALLLCLPVSAEQWEGNAARIRPGEFASPGLFAANNSFPEGTRVRVSSARSGKSVEVTVTRRVNGATGIFLLLSDQAADALGVAAGEVERVVAAPVVVVPAKDLSPMESRKDPDDPRTGLAKLLQDLKATDAEPAAKPPEQPKVRVADTPKPAEPIPPPPAEEPAKPLAEVVTREPQKQLFQPPQEPAGPPAVAQAPLAEPPAVEPEPAPAAPAEVPENLAPYLAREPQKRLFLQPREEEIAVTTVPQGPRIVAAAPVALQEPAPPAAPGPTPAVAPVAETGPEPSDVAPRVAEAPLVEPPLASPQPPVDVAVAPVPVETGPVVTEAAPAPVAAQPAPVARLGGAPPPEVPAERPAGALVLAPTEGRPPQATPPAAAPARPEPAAQPAVVAARAAPPGDRAYYVQLGAFADEASAREVERRYRTTYPIDVQAGARNGRSFYRVVVGPLGRDETGSVLQRFQALGFRDAFVRSLN